MLVSFFFRELWKDWSYTILFIISLVLGLGSVIGIVSYKDSLKNKILSEAVSLMGGDLNLETPEKPSENSLNFLNSSFPPGTIKTEYVQFPSMILVPKTKETSLALVKAVENIYPLKGKVETKPANAIATLKSGEIILDPSLISKLKISIGDSIQLGEKKMKVVATLEKDLASGGSFMAMAAPGIFLLSDLDSTKLVERGSRIRYHFLISLPKETDSKEFKDKNFQSFLQNDFTIFHSTEVGSGSQKFLYTTLDYLSLLSLSALFCGAITIFLLVRSKVRSRLKDLALVKCIGAKNIQIVQFYYLEILSLSIPSWLLSLFVGFKIQQYIPNLTGNDLLLQILPALPLKAILLSFVLGVVLPCLIVWESALVIYNIPPLWALRSREEGSIYQKRFLILSILGFYIFFFTVSSLETNSLFKGGMFSLVLLAVPILFYGLYFLSRSILLGLLKQPIFSQGARLGIRKFSREGSLMFVGLGFGLFLFILSLTLQESLLELGGNRSISERANLFVLDIKKAQLPEFQERLNKYNPKALIYAPVIGARLTAINGEPIQKETEKEALERNWRSTARTREYFLSYRTNLYESEKITSGKFWDEDATDEISVEKDFSKYLRAGIGDELEFNVLGRKITGKITNLRSVNWADLKPNFVVLFSKGILEKAPSFSIASFAIQDLEARYAMEKEMISKFPNLTIIDTEKAVQSFLGILEKVTGIVRLLTGFLLTTCFFLISSTIYSTRNERREEAKLLRLVGASRKILFQIFFYEGLILVLLTFFFAVGISFGSEYFLSTQLFQIESVIPWMSYVFVFLFVFFVVQMLILSPIVS